MMAYKRYLAQKFYHLKKWMVKDTNLYQMNIIQVLHRVHHGKMVLYQQTKLFMDWDQLKLQLAILKILSKY